MSCVCALKHNAGEGDENDLGQVIIAIFRPVEVIQFQQL